MQPLLIEIDTTTSIPQTSLANQIRGWFQENGTLAFEHGFQAKPFTYGGVKCRPYMCDEGGVSVSCVNGEFALIFQKFRTTKNTKISWSLLPKQTLLKIVRECNRYMTQG